MTTLSIQKPLVTITYGVPRPTEMRCAVNFKNSTKKCKMPPKNFNIHYMLKQYFWIFG